MNNNIRLKTRTLISGHTELLFVFPPFGQTRSLQNTLQDHFSPVSLLFDIPFKRPGQITGFVTDLQVKILQFLQLCFQISLILQSLFVGFLNLVLKKPDFFPQRLQNTADVFLVNLSKFFGMLFQDPVCHIFKFDGKFLLQLFHLPFLADQLFLKIDQLGFCTGQLSYLLFFLRFRTVQPLRQLVFFLLQVKRFFTEPGQLLLILCPNSQQFILRRLPF